MGGIEMEDQFTTKIRLQTQYWRLKNPERLELFHDKSHYQEEKSTHLMPIGENCDVNPIELQCRSEESYDADEREL